MVIELGSALGMIRLTAEYSNAVMVALLPIVSDVGEKLDLPVPHPITTNDVASFNIIPQVNPLAAGITTKAGWGFLFSQGHVTVAAGTNSFFMLDDPTKIPDFFGEVNMSKQDAIVFARDTIKRLEIPLDGVFADQDPIVSGPMKIKTNTVPHYLIKWEDPRSGSKSVEIEVNGNRKCLERLYLSNKCLERPSPIIPYTQTEPSLTELNPDYAQKLIPITLDAIDSIIEKFSLPITHPLTTNHIKRFYLGQKGQPPNIWPHAEVQLTNDYRFVFRNNLVTGFYAPDNFFDSEDHPIVVSSFIGKWTITEDESLTLARAAVRKLGHPTNLVNLASPPESLKAHTTGSTVIPRIKFYWWISNSTKSDLEAKVEVEIDAGTKTVKSVYFDHVSFWGHPPKIEVPLLLKNNLQN